MGETKRKATTPKRGRPPKTGERMMSSLTLRISAEEHEMLEAARERLTAESLAQGDARAWSLADVVRRAIRRECGKP